MRYDEYYELSEKNTWRVCEIDWDLLAAEARDGLVTPADRAALVGTAVIEHGVPHYAEVWSLVEGLRKHWQLWQFVTLWTGEEHRHSYALHKACTVLGETGPLETDLDVVRDIAFAEKQKESCPADCLRTVPGMVTYATIQELATFRFYSTAAKRTQSTVLRRLFSEIGADEMRHHVFYREALHEGYQQAADRAWYVDRVAEATGAFLMPHAIYQLQVDFFESGLWNPGPDIVPQLARCFAFDADLMRRLAAAHMSKLAA